MLAAMLTSTTYGTWLRGDRRGWVDDGIVLPPDPPLEDFDRRHLAHPPFLFEREELSAIGEMIGRSLMDRLKQTILAMTVQTWHVHFVVKTTRTPLEEVMKCAKDAVRYGLRAGRPIWTADFDQRFCFDEESAVARIRYVERHNERDGLPSRPWNWIAPWS